MKKSMHKKMEDKHTYKRPQEHLNAPVFREVRESAVDITINLLVNFRLGSFVEIGTKSNLYFSGRVHTWHSQRRAHT